MSEDLATLMRGIGKIAASLRERAETLKWANASHLHAVADSLDAEVEAAAPHRRKWRDAPVEKQIGTYKGAPITARVIETDHLEPIRAVFRQCGMYDAAADDRLCEDLRIAALGRAVEVPVVDMKEVARG